MGKGFNSLMRTLGKAVGGVASGFKDDERGAQAHVQRRIFHLMREFPEMSDEAIATLARDEIVNQHGEDKTLLKWAKAETVARIRRTVAVEMARAERERSKT